MATITDANRKLASPEAVAAFDAAMRAKQEAAAFAADLRRKLVAADARQRATSQAASEACHRVNREAADVRTELKRRAKQRAGANV